MYYLQLIIRSNKLAIYNLCYGCQSERLYSWKSAGEVPLTELPLGETGEREVAGQGREDLIGTASVVNMVSIVCRPAAHIVSPDSVSQFHQHLTVLCA